MLVAHRGGSRLAPENTMAAFRAAIDDWGADMLELDVRLSKDGVVMVIHDETVDRTTDGLGRVADHTLACYGAGLGLMLAAGLANTIVKTRMSTRVGSGSLPRNTL